MCELDPVHLLQAPGLTWKAALKKTKVELEYLMILNPINSRNFHQGGICHANYCNIKTSNKYMKD